MYPGNQATLYMVHNTHMSQGRSGHMTVTGDGNTVTQRGRGEITVNGVYCDIIQESNGYISVNGNHCRISQHTDGQLVIHGNDHEIRQYGRGYIRIIGTGNRIHVYGDGEISLRGRSRNNYVAIHSNNAQVRDHGRHNVIENVNRERQRRRENMHRHYDRLLDDFMADNERHEKEARDQLMRTIRQLPVSETTAKEMKKKEECAICIGQFEEKEKIMTLPCFHRFHAECATECLEDKAVCPMCRAKIKVHD